MCRLHHSINFVVVLNRRDGTLNKRDGTLNRRDGTLNKRDVTLICLMVNAKFWPTPDGALMCISFKSFKYLTSTR